MREQDLDIQERETPTGREIIISFLGKEIMRGEITDTVIERSQGTNINVLSELRESLVQESLKIIRENPDASVN